MLLKGTYRCKNTMFVKGNRSGRDYTLLAEESIITCSMFLSWRFGHENMCTAHLTLILIQEESGESNVH